MQRPISISSGHSGSFIHALLNFIGLQSKSKRATDSEKGPIKKKVFACSQYHLTRKEVNSIVTAGRTLRDRLILRTLAETAIRRFELVNLKVSDIRFNQCQLFIRYGKGNKSRVIPITRNLRDELTEFVGNRIDGYLFLSRTGSYLSVRQLNRIVANAGKLAKVQNPNPLHTQITCHLFRHTFARRWKEQNGSIESLSSILGHSSIATTLSLYGTESMLDVDRNYRRIAKQVFNEE